MARLGSIVQAVIFCAVLITATAAQTPTITLDSCQDGLDEIHKAASEASEAAHEAKSKGDDLDECRQDPETYDLMHDNCRSIDRDYQSALSDLENKMDDLDGRLRSVQDSCQYSFTINRLNSSEAAQKKLEAAERRLCVSYHHLIEMGLPLDSALQMCKANADERWCRQCFGLK